MLFPETMKNPHFFLLFIFVGMFLLTYTSCVHEPILPTGFPIDTTGNPPDTTQIDTTKKDTTTSSIKLCDPDSVYFEKDVLPILISNCAKSGCHDEITRQEGFSLTSYENVMNSGEVDPFDLDGSDLYEVITETRADKIMPPPPNSALDQSEIDIIAKWISQGAQDLSCTEDTTGGCDTVDVSFSGTVFPILDTYCTGCHSGNDPSGGVNLSNYEGVKLATDNGRLYGAVAHLPGYSKMPQGGTKLPDCDIAQIKSWIDNGLKDN